MESLKISVWGLWIGAGSAMGFGGPEVALIGRYVFLGTLLVHLAEFAWKRPLFARAGGSLGHHFVHTMIYGLFHWKPIEDRLG
jgi:hypothetical protein